MSATANNNNLSALSFPTQSLVGSVGDFARIMAHGTEVPEEFYFAAGLTMLGAICRDDLKLDVGCDVDPRLYTVLLGESYGVKKSTAMRKSMEFFTENGLLTKGFDGPDTVHVSHGAASAEGLARVLKDHSHTVLAYDELRTFIDKCQIQASTLLPMVTSLFEGRTWQNPTKKASQSTSVNNARLSLIGCCTRDTYADMWTNKALNIGLPNRLFIVNADRKAKVAWPQKPDSTEIGVVSARMRAQISKLPRTLSITPEGKAAWDQWYNDLPSSPHANRLDTIGFRLLALIALTTDKSEIDLDVVSAVTDILDYEYRIRQVTDPIDAESKVAQLEVGIRRQLAARGPLDERDLRRYTNADKKGYWAFKSALDNVKAARDVRANGNGLYELIEDTRQDVNAA
jgi:hypothetical protein